MSNRVPAPTSKTLDGLYQTIISLCHNTEVGDNVADAYTVVLNTGFVASRTLDLTASPSATDIANLLATLLMDLKKRGTNRKAANV